MEGKQYGRRRMGVLRNQNLPDLLWLNCWCESMLYTRDVSAKCNVNAKSPVVISGNILFAKNVSNTFLAL